MVTGEGDGGKGGRALRLRFGPFREVTEGCSTILLYSIYYTVL